MMNDDSLVKYVGIPMLLLMAFLGAVLPRIFIPSMHHQSYALAIGNSLAGGVFFAAGLLHMLAEAIDALSDHNLSAGSGNYPVAIFLCCIGFLMTFFFERVLVRGGHDAIIAALDLHKDEPSTSSRKMMNGQDDQGRDDNDHMHAVAEEEPVTPDHRRPLEVKVDACCDEDYLTNGDDEHYHHGHSHHHPLHHPLPSLREQQKQQQQQHKKNNRRTATTITTHSNYQTLPQSPRQRADTLPVAIRSYLRSGGASPRRTSASRSSSGLRHTKVRVKYYSKLFESGLRTGVLLANELQAHENPRAGSEVGKVHIHETEREVGSVNPIPYIILSVLSLHAFITGIALGTTSDFSNTTTLLAVLALHKFSAAGSLSIVFLKCNLDAMHAWKLLTFFSVTTPTGLAFGILLDHYGLSSELVSGIFMSVSAGTFLYIAIMSIIVDEFVESTSHLYKKFFALMCGFAIMSAVALVA